MRGPEEAMNSDAQSLPIQEEGSNGRDPCSSPPCKRLKQAVLNFNSNTSPTSGCSLPSNSSSSSSPKLKFTNGIANEVIVIEDEDRATSCGGLVTAAPSPPDKGHLKAQSFSPGYSTSTSKDTNDVKNQPTISQFTIPINKQNESPESGNKEIPCTPKQTYTDTTKTPLKPTSVEKKKSKEEMQKIKEEKQKLREEKEKQRLEAKALKEKERIEAREKKEQERLEKQAEKEKKGKERLEKKQKEDKEKQEKKEKKEEERRKKEEETNAKLTEKRKKEEEKKQQEEELQRKRKQASISFKNFFTKATAAPPKTLPKAVLKFEPFEIKPHMSLAPVVRMQLSKDSQEELNELMKEQSGISLYMAELQNRKPLPRCSKKSRQPKSSNQEELMEINEKKDRNDVLEISDDECSNSSSITEIQQEEKKRMKAIFLKFYENNRPPYYGTQRKKSKKISARNPLKKDEALLNYEVDSDDEWEEEEPGESLSDDDGDDDDAGEEGEEEDDGFMVPHGYLSDDEGIDVDEDGGQEEGTNSRKEQQLAKVKAWEAELKKKCKAKKPVCIGCIWPDNDDINEVLQQFEACVLVDGPTIAIHNSSSNADVSYSVSENTTATPDNASKVGMFVPEEAIPDLITLIHRSTAGIAKLMDYFKQHWSKKCQNSKAHLSLAGKNHISKRQLEAKIKAIATKERRNDKNRWYVHSNVLASYGLSRLEETENKQTAALNEKSDSPLTINKGNQVLNPELTSVIKPQNAVSQPIAIGNIQGKHLPQNSVTLSKDTTVQASFLENKFSLKPNMKCRVILQPISKPDTKDVEVKGNLPKPLLSGGKPCCSVVEASDSCTKDLPSDKTIANEKSEQETAKHSPLDGLKKSSSIVTNRIDSSCISSATNVEVAMSSTGCLSTALKRTAPFPAGNDRAAKVPRKSSEGIESFATATDSIQSISALIDTSLGKTNKQISPGPLLCSQSYNSKETMPEPMGSSFVSEISKVGSSSDKTLECTVHKAGDGVKPMEIEQITKA